MKLCQYFYYLKKSYFATTFATSNYVANKYFFNTSNFFQPPNFAIKSGGTPCMARLVAALLQAICVHTKLAFALLQKKPSLKLKNVLTLEEVPGFSLTRVHPGGKIGDTRGCPLPGLATDMDADSNFVVGRSREALKRIHRHLDSFFDEKGMDFTIPVWWEILRVPLIALH